MSVRVVVADDQPLVREGPRKIFEIDPEIEVRGDVADGNSAVEAARRLRPDVVVMDIRMPVMDGIEATRLIVKGTSAPPRVLVLTHVRPRRVRLRRTSCGCQRVTPQGRPGVSRPPLRAVTT